MDAQVLTNVMQCGDAVLRQRATDVLHSIVQNDSSPLREFMLGQTPRPVLLSLMLQYVPKTCIFKNCKEV